MKNLLKLLKKMLLILFILYKSDVLGLSEIYYKKYRKDNKDLWQSAQVDVKVNLKINTKGYIFEVN